MKIDILIHMIIDLGEKMSGLYTNLRKKIVGQLGKPTGKHQDGPYWTDPLLVLEEDDQSKSSLRGKLRRMGFNNLETKAIMQTFASRRIPNTFGNPDITIALSGQVAATSAPHLIAIYVSDGKLQEACSGLEKEPRQRS